MAVKFKDYYEILGVPRDASSDDIQRAYRKLARKNHPDLNKDAGAEERFKEINEAYEVLKDPEKREKYDRIGTGWHQGDDFQAPPGWEYQYDFGPRDSRRETHFWSSGGGFSDFFEELFGGRFGQSFETAPRGSNYTVRRRGADHEATIRLTLEEAFRGGRKSISLQSVDSKAAGSNSNGEKRYDVTIPPGVLPGQRIRLAGQGGKGSGGAASGDMFLRVEVQPHPRYRLEGRDLYTELAVTPWEAALGGQVRVRTLDDTVALKIPPGTQSGRKLRLRGKGMPNPKGRAGDLYVLIQIRVPERLSEEERRLFEKLRDVSSFRPR